MAPLQTCSIWGPTCDSQDCLFPTAQLPQALAVGDWLGFDNMGAYTLPVAGNFNGFEVGKVTYTTGEMHAKEVHNLLETFALVDNPACCK
jgi:ornithine decarboxylase